MAFDPELSFTLRVNDKGDNPKRPDYRGLVTVKGVVYEMAGWKKKRDDGTVTLSGKLKPKEAPKADPGAYQGGEQPKPAPNPASQAENLDEDVPF